MLSDVIRRFRAALGFSLAFLPAASCRDSLGPVPVLLVTDAASYVAALGPQIGTTRIHSFTVIARFTNRSRYTVHLSRCFSHTPYPIHGVDTVDRVSEAAYNPAWACVGANYFDVLPGESRVDTLQLRAPMAFNGITGEPMGVFEGDFVLVYPMYACLDETPECTEPVTEPARSGVFRVTRAN